MTYALLAHHHAATTATTARPQLLDAAPVHPHHLDAGIHHHVATVIAARHSLADAVIRAPQHAALMTRTARKAQ